MIFEFTSYRSFLRAELAERTFQNPRYSLRAFARQLKLSPAILSQAMSAKRNLSSRMAYQVAQNLKLSADESNYFCLLAQYELETHAELKASLHSQLEKLQRGRKRNGPVPRDMELETFKLMSEWYHIPIIEMTELHGFDFAPSNIAKRLGITRLQATAAIERLERLKLIERASDGKFKKTNSDYEFSSKKMSSALNKFHKQMLGRAVEAIDGQPRPERKVISNTFSIDPALLPQAEEILARFRQEMVALFNTGQTNTETYHLGIQLFKLTKSNQGKRKKS